jgi:hypothetical protein
MSHDFCSIGELIFCGKYGIIYIERKLRRDFMSTINRAYCVVVLMKETGEFLDILAVKPSLEEANEYLANCYQHPDYSYLVWAVITE